MNIIRTHCIWCNSSNLSNLFETDYSTPVASYMIKEDTDFESIEYNVQKCEECLSFQTKYLVDLSILYKENHAYSYGSTLKEMCIQFSEFIRSMPDVSNILEIGAGNGFLADTILAKMKELNYLIIDPCYFGNKENRVIVNNIIENCDLQNFKQDTVIFSHVFEHFYEPVKIISLLKSMSNLKNIFLNMPNLELYLEKNTFHVLNTEHTYFVENDFLENFFLSYGFKLEKKCVFKEHSVFFHFVKVESDNMNIILKNRRSLELVSGFFDRIKELIRSINESNDGNPIYMWPCSMHTQFILNFSKDSKTSISLLDNSPDKIGRYLYGFHKPCMALEDVISSNIPSTIILNGGCFNDEIKTMLLNRKTNNIKLIYV
jgi:hypothetical protein